MVREQRNYNAKTKQLLHEKSKKEGQCPRGNCPFAL